MAEAEESKEEGAEQTAPKSSKKTLLLIVSGCVALVLLIGVPLLFLAFRGGEAEKGNDTLAADAARELPHSTLSFEGSFDEDELDEGEEPIGAIFPMETFVVNLSGGRYIRVQMQLEFVEREYPRRLFTRLVPIRDAIIGLLARKSADEVLSERGRDELRREVREVVNEALRKAEVQQVYFTQFVVQ